MGTINRILTGARKLIPGSLLLAAMLAASPIASAHFSNNVYMGGPQNVSWNCNAAFGCLLMVDFVSYTPYPFRLFYDKGFSYQGQWYNFYHRYYVYEHTDGGQPYFHTYYYYTR